MIVYEVNLSVRESIADEYERWLHDHIGQMVRLDGFLGARWLRDMEAPQAERSIVVQYYLRDRTSLHHYLTVHAPEMRREGMERFPDGFTASRRVLELVHDIARPSPDP